MILKLKNVANSEILKRGWIFFWLEIPERLTQLQYLPQRVNVIPYEWQNTK